MKRFAITGIKNGIRQMLFANHATNLHPTREAAEKQLKNIRNNKKSIANIEQIGFDVDRLAVCAFECYPNTLEAKSIYSNFKVSKKYALTPSAINFITSLPNAPFSELSFDEEQRTEINLLYNERFTSDIYKKIKAIYNDIPLSVTHWQYLALSWLLIITDGVNDGWVPSVFTEVIRNEVFAEMVNMVIE